MEIINWVTLVVWARGIIFVGTTLYPLSSAVRVSRLCVVPQGVVRPPRTDCTLHGWGSAVYCANEVYAFVFLPWPARPRGERTSSSIEQPMRGGEGCFFFSEYRFYRCVFTVSWSSWVRVARLLCSNPMMSVLFSGSFGQILARKCSLSESGRSRA